MSIFLELSENLQHGKAYNVAELVKAALDQGFSAKDILQDGLIDGMNVVSKKYKNGDLYVPDLLVASRAMNFGIEMLKPCFVDLSSKSKGRVVIGTVKGDLHDIGKNLVRIMMEGKGLEVIDLGVDVPADRFISATIEHKAHIIACSALLTNTMEQMKNIIKEAVSSGIRSSVKIMIGGAPTTTTFCNSIDADYYTDDAETAAETAFKICQGVT